MTKVSHKAEYEQVFCSHKWGNSANSGKDYKRPYSKTKRAKKEEEKAKPVNTGKGKKKGK